MYVLLQITLEPANRRH